MFYGESVFFVKNKPGSLICMLNDRIHLPREYSASSKNTLRLILIHLEKSYCLQAYYAELFFKPYRLPTNRLQPTSNLFG